MGIKASHKIFKQTDKVVSLSGHCDNWWNERLKPTLKKGGYVYYLPDIHGNRNSINGVESLHRKVLNVPVKVVSDRERECTIIMAHRKTHKRIKKFISKWKPIGVKVVLEHAPWGKLK